METLLSMYSGTYIPNIFRRIIILLTVTLFTTKFLAQDIQPIGLLKGHYEIDAKGKIKKQVFCVDINLHTSAGKIYDKVRLGNQQINLRIGNRVDNLQNAINSNQIKLKLIDFPDDPLNMYLEFQNNTNSPITFDVLDNVILGKKGSKSTLKSVEHLNNSENDLEIEKQDLIWFSQEFPEYMLKNKNIFLENSFIVPSDNLDVMLFLKKRKEILESNGVTLEDSRYCKKGFILGSEFSLGSLLEKKSKLRKFNSDGFEKQFIIRYKEGKYFVDNGSTLPIYIENDVYELANKLGNSETIYVQFEGFSSKIREENFLTTLKIARKIPGNAEFRDFLFDKTPLLKTISEITEENKKSLFEINVVSKTISPNTDSEHSIIFKEPRRSMIISVKDMIYNYFGGLNKKSSQSLASILEESKTEIKKNFTESQLEIILDHRIQITLNDKNYKQFFENLYYCYDINNKAE